MKSIIEQFFRDNWQIISKKEDLPNEFRIMKLGGHSSSEASLNLILFKGKDSLPKYFLKINRKIGKFSIIEQEFKDLRHLKNCLPHDLAATVPHPVFLGKLDDQTLIMVEKFLTGKKIDFNNHTQLSQLFSKSFDWLKAFYSTTKNDTINFKWSDFKEALSKGIESIETMNELRQKLFAILKRSNEFDGIKLPISSVQGDFDFDNILMNNGEIRIIDWEDYKDSSLPFIDVEFFIFNLGQYFYRKDGHVKSFKSFFSKDTKTYKLADYYISNYCRYLGLEKPIFYLISIKDTLDIIKNGYGKHKKVPMQSIYFLNALADLSLRELG